ncbi:MAG: CDP-glycerol glycerophosphotransferase family protein [Desulfuromonadaceae bacterium]
MFFFSYMLRQSKRFVLNVPFVFASFFPRRKDLWLFGSWFGNKYLDNSKYLYLFSQKQPDVTAVWITKDIKLFEKMKNQGLPVAYSASLKGIWLQLRCGTVIFSHSVPTEFNAYLIASKVFRVQAWHGIPLKKIGYDDDKCVQSLKRGKILQQLFPYLTDHCDLILAAGKEDSNKFQTAFNTKKERIIITGYPRNDMFFKTTATKNYFDINNSKDLKHIIYMPTFRGAIGSEFPLLAKSGFNYHIYDKMFQQAGIILEIKLHPVQTLSQMDADQICICCNIKIADESGDIYESLPHFDALITDYSSIYFDFLLTGKPIYMAPFDIDSYLSNDRSMYYEYSEVCPSEIHKNWDELIGDIIQNNYDYIKYNELRRRFHVHVDGNSSKRTFEAIQGIFNS